VLPLTNHADDIVNDPRGIAIINFLFGAANPQTDYDHPRLVTDTFISHIQPLLDIINHTLVDCNNQPVRPIEAISDPKLSLSTKVIKLTLAQQNFHFHSIFDQEPNSWLIHILYILRFVLDWRAYGSQVSIRVGVHPYTILLPNNANFLET